MSKNDAPPSFAFPADLTALQARLHRARADYEALSRTLPWSVEPMPGWARTVHPNSKVVTDPGREPSPGYTPEQLAEDTRLRALVRDLSDQVSTHSYWGTLERGPQLVDARIALKSHPDVLAAGEPAVAEAA
ncbi:hypothetical protein [Streptomyces sp. NPDC056169]|uniref:hypothetical protein n=1 Tax=Streptomyces sp. NPDC056169 TaxID=3345734 RepID=UPI0035DE0912